MSFLSHSHTGVPQNGIRWQGMTLYRIQSHRSTDDIQPMPLIEVSMVTTQRVTGHYYYRIIYIHTHYSGFHVNYRHHYKSIIHISHSSCFHGIYVKGQWALIF